MKVYIVTQEMQDHFSILKVFSNAAAAEQFCDNPPESIHLYWGELYADEYEVHDAV